MMCPHDIYCVLSFPLAGGARATLQTAHLSNPLWKQCARGTRCTVLIPYTRSFPLHDEISGVRAHEDYTGMASRSSILPFVSEPMCRGSEPLYMPPLNYKRGGIQRYKGGAPGEHQKGTRQGHSRASHSSLHTAQASTTIQHTME
jgi:hypothetical protein